MPQLDHESAAELRNLEQIVIERKLERDSQLAYLEKIRQEIREHKLSVPEVKGDKELAKLEAREATQAALVRVRTREMALAIAELEEYKAKLIKQKGFQEIDLKPFEKRTALERDALENERKRYARLSAKQQELEQGVTP